MLEAMSGGLGTLANIIQTPFFGNSLTTRHCCLVAKSCSALCDPMNCSTPDLPVLHYLPLFAQIYVHWVKDAIQQSPPLLPAFPPALNFFFQHQGLFQWADSSLQWPKHCSFSFTISPSSEYSGLISFRIEWFDFLSPRDSQESSPAAQLKSINSLALSLLYGPTLISIHDYWKNHSYD